MNKQEIIDQIKKLEKRKEMCLFQRRITTSILTAIEYDLEIDSIDRRLIALNHEIKTISKKSKHEQKES